MSRTLVLVAAALCAPALAQTPAATSVGTVNKVQGEARMRVATDDTIPVAGAEIADGATISTGAAGMLTLTTLQGCTVVLQANQSVSVRSNLSCGQLLASVKPVPAPVAAAAPADEAPGFRQRVTRLYDRLVRTVTAQP